MHRFSLLNLSRKWRLYPTLAALLLNLAPVAAGATALTLSSVKVEDRSLHLEAVASNAASLANTQLLIDTDADAKTGYAGVGPDHGYDVMVEGTTVYKFKGADPAAWAWDKVGVAVRGGVDKKLTFDVPIESLGTLSPKPVVLLRALTPDYATVLAATPPTVVSNGSAAGPVDSKSKDPAPAAGLTAKASQDGSTLSIVVTAESATDLNTILIFFDTDANADTGFQPPADPHFGFEYMIQGASLSKHTGDLRGGWSWDTVAAVQQSAAGSTETITFNAALLKSSKVKMSVWQMSPDWQTRTGFFPATGGAAGLLDVPIDASKLHAAASGPPVDAAPAHANAGLPAAQRFHQARTYACFYGPGQYNALSHVDAAVLHVPAQNPVDVAALEKAGVVAIGYLSVGEDETLRVGSGKGPGGKASWYFNRKQPDQPDENGIWGSYYANAADPAWRADRVDQARKLCGNGPGEWGFDGIFLDTIETVDAYPESREGMIELVEQLHAALPGKVIVINRGFSLLKEPRVSGNIDGLMYESFTDSYDFATKTYLKFAPQDLDSTRVVMQSTVQPAVARYGLRVLALDYMQPDQTAVMQDGVNRAATFGMVPGLAPISLDAVYPVWTFTPHPDLKYLGQISTPESLQYTLPTARNGFPAGTVVRPSSCYMGYIAASVVDGIKDRSHLDWSRSAWASAETPGVPEDLTLELPEPIHGKNLKITFATDNGKTYPSRQLSILGSSTDDGPWRELARATDLHDAVYTCRLPNEPVKAVKIVQAAGGGNADRPDIMWVAQVELED